MIIGCPCSKKDNADSYTIVSAKLNRKDAAVSMTLDDPVKLNTKDITNSIWPSAQPIHDKSASAAAGDDQENNTLPNFWVS